MVAGNDEQKDNEVQLCYQVNRPKNIYLHPTAKIFMVFDTRGVTDLPPGAGCGVGFGIFMASKYGSFLYLSWILSGAGSAPGAGSF